VEEIPMFDVIIVGARCAGSPLGMLLAQKGHSVLVVDRAKFPSDTLSTHFIAPDGAGRLRKWGLFDRIAEAGAPVFRGLVRSMGGMTMPPNPEDPPTFAPRRTVLDDILVQAAREAGAEVREGVLVESVILADGVAVGIRGRTGDEPFEERGRVIVGADGRESFVARQVGAEEYNPGGGTTAGYYAYFKNFPAATTELYLGGGAAHFVFPTNEGEVCLATEIMAERFKEFRGDVEGNFVRSFEAMPPLRERMQGAERASKIFGFAPHPGFYRKPFGPGWALAGDAGYYRDPILGQGINDAFRDADELSTALDATLGGRADWDEALGQFEKSRNEQTAGIYFISNLLCSNLDPSMETMAILAGGPPPAQQEPAAVS
jgi:flavin-dependent dehydrogenase